jgi:hypothetical protein
VLLQFGGKHVANAGCGIAIDGIGGMGVSLQQQRAAVFMAKPLRGRMDRHTEPKQF